jgi:hypothetical protein
LSGGGGGAGAGGTTSTANSCVGHCGGPSASGTCYCDVDCLQVGDCCADVVKACGSGTGGATNVSGCTPQLCGSSVPGKQNGAPCYCDTQCMNFGDCCFNKFQVCGY